MSKVLKGFANLSSFAVSKNSATEYEVGTKQVHPTAQSCTQSDTRQDYSIPGDDGVVAKGSDYQGTQLVITVAETELEALSKVTGATFDNESGEYTDAELDNAPEVALTFSGLLEGGGYRLFRYYACKLSSYKADLNTKPSNQSGSTYQLTFECYGRKCDPKKHIRTYKDVAAGAALTWLDTIPAVPAGGQG